MFFSSFTMINYQEQSRADSCDFLLPSLALNLTPPLLAGRLPTILDVVHLRKTDRSFALGAF